MTRQPVNSSSIASVGYDPDFKTLHVEFQSGKVYEYAGVSPDEHESLISAGSIGSHFSKHIRGRYQGTPLD